MDAGGLITSLVFYLILTISIDIFLTINKKLIMKYITNYVLYKACWERYE